MTVPHECRYFHPLDAEANSHVAEDLHGEVAQGAVPTCARSQQMQQNKQWNILELLQYVQWCFNLLYILDIMDLWNVKRANMDQVWSPLALSFLHWNGLHSDTCSKLATSTKSRVTFLRVAVLWNAFIAATKLDEMGPNFMQMATITWHIWYHMMRVSSWLRTCSRKLPSSSSSSAKHWRSSCPPTEKLQLIARHKCSVHCTCSPHPTVVTRMQYRS